MKNITKLFLGILLSGIILTGCDEATGFLDVKIPVTYETDLEISTTSLKSTNGTFLVMDTIDPESNSDYTLYLDKIKGVEVLSFYGVVDTINPNVTIDSTIIMISSISNDSLSAIWTFNDLYIEDGTEITFGNEDAQWDNIEAILLEKKAFIISINGFISEEEADFIIHFILNAEIIASPLN